jgi:ribosomal protein L11
MMHNWFETKISYEKEIEGGMMKKVTEPYLVDALSFTEAEARIIKEMTPFMSGEFTVANIKRANYTEVFEDETGDRWYRAKVVFITIDEKSGAEKKSASNMLVQALSMHQALENLDKGMKGTMADYEIASITETMLMDIFPYAVDEDAKSE